MKLIVNADDFGLCQAVNEGIIKAYREGIVRSTTILVNGGTFLEAVELAKKEVDLGVGIHLALTFGKPLLKNHQTLNDENGHFFSLSYLTEHVHEISEEELLAEWDAQISKALEHGVALTHMDSHHHVHMLEKCMPVVKTLAEKYHLPFRYHGGNFEEFKKDQCVEIFTDTFYDQDATSEKLIEFLEQHLNASTVEVMVHPSLVDDELCQLTRYAHQRERELEILTSSLIKEWIEAKNIELTNYRYL